jgi:serine/threonine-protein kinase
MSASLSVLGKYEIRGILGRGAAGTVYDAWDPIIRRRVAIKTVKLPTSDDPDTQEELDRFRREAQAAGRLSHANIVPVFDYGENTEIAYIVMEYVGGGSLKKLMDEYKQVPLNECLRVMEQLLAGLQFSHDRGIVHRDIKPANVMLSDDNTVKITDFGIARIEGGSGATMVGTMLGTPAYMSPEQWRGDANIDARSDIYASGVLLFHMLAGRRPFEGSNQSAIMLAVLKGDFRPPSTYVPGLSAAVDAVVLKAMATDPQDRYASAISFAEALRIAVTNPAAVAPAPAPAVSIPDDDGTIIQTSSRGARPPSQDPLADRPGTSQSVARPVPAPVPAPAAPAKSGMGMGAIIGIVVAVLLVAGGGGAFFLMGGKKETAPPMPVATAPETKPEIAAQPPVSPPPVSPPPVSPPTVAPPKVAPPETKTVETPPVVPAAPPVAPTTAPTTTAITPPPVPATPSLRDVVASIPCAAVYGDTSPAHLALRGVVPPDSYAALQASYADTPAQSRSFDVQRLPARSFYCQVMDTLRPVLRTLGEQAGVTAALLPSPTNHTLQLVENDPIDFDIIGPDMPSVLQVDYIDSTGSVSHYMPRTKAQPVIAARRLKANEHIRLFDNMATAAFAVGPPAGIDMVVIIASSEPLQMQHSKEDDESASVYVSELRAALDAARKRGIRMSVEIVPVESLPTKK